jgi:hypothetical protein
MWRIYGGAITVIAGIAAFIEAHANQPVAASGPLRLSARQILALRPRGEPSGAVPASGLSPTAYDLLRIAGWALVILGVLTVLVGLIAFATTPRSGPLTTRRST